MLYYSRILIIFLLTALIIPILLPHRHEAFAQEDKNTQIKIICGKQILNGLYLSQYSNTSETIGKQIVKNTIADIPDSQTIINNPLDPPASTPIPQPTSIPTTTPSPLPYRTAASKPQKQNPAPHFNSTETKLEPLPPSGFDPLIDRYGKEYGIDPGKLKKMARCESHFNPKAVNGAYGGLYQFSSSTWQSTRKAMGVNPDPNLRFDPEEAIKTTAFKISHGGLGAWPVCGKR